MSVRPGQNGTSPSRRSITSSSESIPTSAAASAVASAPARTRAAGGAELAHRIAPRGQRRLPKYFLYCSAEAASAGSASSFGCIFSHAAARLAGMYSVGQ